MASFTVLPLFRFHLFHAFFVWWIYFTFYPLGTNASCVPSSSVEDFTEQRSKQIVWISVGFELYTPSNNQMHCECQKMSRISLLQMEVTLGEDRVRKSEVLIIRPDEVVAQNAVSFSTKHAVNSLRHPDCGLCNVLYILLYVWLSSCRAEESLSRLSRPVT